MRRCLLCAVVSLLGCASQQLAPPPPEVEPTPTPAPVSFKKPVARVDDVVETKFGVETHDPYRWMEKGGPEFDAFLDAQDAKARAAFDALPGRDVLRERLRTASRSMTRVRDVRVIGNRIFSMRRAPGDDVFKLYVRTGADGADELLVDPAARDANGVHYAIDFVVPAPDGKHVALGISASGSEDSVIEILDVASKTSLPERIDRAQYANVNWKDDASFFYWRRRKPAEGDTQADWFKNSSAHLHTLGGDPETEVALLSPSSPGLGIDPMEFVNVVGAPRSNWLVGLATPGTTGSLSVFVAPVSALGKGPLPWRRVASPADEVSDLDVVGDKILVLTFNKAPRYKVLAIDAKKGTFADAKVFVPESERVLEGFSVASDGVYVRSYAAGVDRIERFSLDGRTRTPVELPFPGPATVSASPFHPGIAFSTEGWTHAASWSHFDGKRRIDLKLTEPWPTDYASLLTVEEVEATSADGSKIGLSIIHPRDFEKNGAAPALLEGYASYGFVESPFFWPTQLVFAQHGGVVASCNGRGTGDRGKQWHLDGTKHNKERGIEDFIACAQYLVKNGYTRPSRLGVTGTSAGGVLIGGAITREPTLFGVALMRVPELNLSRMFVSEGGVANFPEFGDPSIEEDYRHLVASDPYHRLKAGVRYPAIIVTSGRHDVRVPAWIPAKFVARIQALSPERPVFFRVERDAGHGMGSTQTQQEDEWADLHAFLLSEAGVPVK